ncbi:MAG: hypothetical protein MJY98_12845, partial [Fibrobacter sp.]|nr:hypothetical protein [Fibrobacter sp.]
EFVTFEVVGETYPEVVKCGAGSSSQAIELGQPIVDFCYTWTGAETVKADGFPKGITTDIDNAAKKISISGTPTEAGEFAFKVYAINNDSTFTKTGKITVTDPNAPASSSSQEPAEESSSSNEECIDEGACNSEGNDTAIRNIVNLSTEVEAGFYRIFDMQGRPLFSGERKPNKMPAARVVVIEYTKSGAVKKRYIQAK